MNSSGSRRLIPAVPVKSTVVSEPAVSASYPRSAGAATVGASTTIPINISITPTYNWKEFR